MTEIRLNIYQRIQKWGLYEGARRVGGDSKLSSISMKKILNDLHEHEVPFPVRMSKGTYSLAHEEVVEDEKIIIL